MEKIEIRNPKQIRDFAEIFDLENMHIWNGFFDPYNNLCYNTETDTLELRSWGLTFIFKGEGIVNVLISKDYQNEKIHGKIFYYDTHLNLVPFGDRLAEVLGEERAIEYSKFLTPAHQYHPKLKRLW